MYYITWHENIFWFFKQTNPLNAELNSICHLLALLWAHHIFHVSRIGVNFSSIVFPPTPPLGFLIRRSRKKTWNIFWGGGNTCSEHWNTFLLRFAWFSACKLKFILMTTKKATSVLICCLNFHSVWVCPAFLNCIIYV